MVRLVQIGLGGWGRDWAREVLPAVPEVEPVAFVDGDPATRELAREALRIAPAKLFASLDEAVAATGPTAALVVVPLAAHAAVTEAALRRGLHVLVEKPFTETLSEAAALVELAAATKLHLMVNQNYRHFPTPRAFRRLVADGALGHVASIAVDFWKAWDENYRYFFLAEPLLSDMAIHHFDMMRYVLDDEPEAVTAMSWSEPGTPFQGRPAAAALIRFRRGTVVSYRGTWISRGPDTPWGADWRIDGSAAAALGRFRGNQGDRRGADRVTLYTAHDKSRPLELEPLPRIDRAGALAAFAAWVGEGRPAAGLSTGADNLESLCLMHAAIRSAAEHGRLVPLAEIANAAGIMDSTATEEGGK
ncbi:MAG: Gfo/Idh/MocA family oxidoreductase [Geminicoccaceae bacterium]|nr:Gfo/Idh/MocA family oxidoreductase [Geminicoccaceae bacterium]HRY23156.1 Gfo/Idh/MocA family oxidoreductase [Geminicoccaceae bacterium]